MVTVNKKSTISKLLRYKITRTQRIALYMLEHINWCWGRWGTSFDGIMDMVQKLDYFDPVKFKKFKRDLKKLCEEHDIDFGRGWLFLKFWKANRVLVEGIDKLTHWIEEKDQKKKELALKALKLGLNTVGMKYYRWSFKTATFESLFTNYKYIWKK